VTSDGDDPRPITPNADNTRAENTRAENTRADNTWVGPMAEVYDRCLGPGVFAPFAAELATRARAFADPDQVLELAAGTGILTAGLVAAFPDAVVTATDLNPAMVAYAEDRVPDASWRVADALSLGDADATIDLVCCQFGVMFFPDKVTAYREVRRVLTPGGLFLFNAWDTLDTHEVEAAAQDSFVEVLGADAPDFLARVPHGYADPDRMRADVEAAGLRFESVVRNVVVGVSASAASLAEGYCLGTPNRFELQDRGELAEIVPRVSAALTRRLGEGAVEASMAAYAVRAYRPD
jgi:SAM-dependent methyltransferase